MSKSVTVSDNVMKRFEDCVGMRKGWKKGNKKICADEALTDWCDKIEAKVN